MSLSYEFLLEQVSRLSQEVEHLKVEVREFSKVKRLEKAKDQAK